MFIVLNQMKCASMCIMNLIPVPEQGDVVIKMLISLVNIHAGNVSYS